MEVLLKKILIVDDAIFMRKSLRMILEQSNYEVVGEAENGQDALEQYKLLKPDIVTMDITMPVMNGIDSLKAIVQEDSKANVVMISAVGQESYVKEAIISGAKSFIIKPFKGETVIQILNTI